MRAEIASISILILEVFSNEQREKELSRKTTTGISKEILKGVSASGTEVPQQESLIHVNAVVYSQAPLALLQARHTSWRFDEWARV